MTLDGNAEGKKRRRDERYKSPWSGDTAKQPCTQMFLHGKKSRPVLDAA